MSEGRGWRGILPEEAIATCRTVPRFSGLLPLYSECTTFALCYSLHPLLWHRVSKIAYASRNDDKTCILITKEAQASYKK